MTNHQCYQCNCTRSVTRQNWQIKFQSPFQRLNNIYLLMEAIFSLVRTKIDNSLMVVAIATIRPLSNHRGEWYNRVLREYCWPQSTDGITWKYKKNNLKTKPHVRAVENVPQNCAWTATTTLTATPDKSFIQRMRAVCWRAVHTGS